MNRWNPVTDYPNNSRCVMMRFDHDGKRDAVGFFWRDERSWFKQHGSKRLLNAVHPVLWRELESNEWTELEPQEGSET